jgi:hypothetical protein
MTNDGQTITHKVALPFYLRAPYRADYNGTIDGVIERIIHADDALFEAYSSAKNYLNELKEQGGAENFKKQVANFMPELLRRMHRDLANE